MRNPLTSLAALIFSGAKIAHPIDAYPTRSNIYSGKKAPSSWGKSTMRRGYNRDLENARRRRQIEHGILTECNGLLRK